MIENILTYGATLISIVAVYFLAVSGKVVDIGYAFLGVVVTAFIFFLWLFIRKYAPNPYDGPLYRIKFPDYSVWAVQEQPDALGHFKEGDLIRVLYLPGQAYPMDEEDRLVLRVSQNDVIAVEPNDGRQARIPVRLLAYTSNLDAWLYERRWHRRVAQNFIKSVEKAEHEAQ